MQPIEEAYVQGLQQALQSKPPIDNQAETDVGKYEKATMKLSANIPNVFALYIQLLFIEPDPYALK
ncbi:hypothetical protein JMJ77_0011874 [Colletotrichum scovillei]|uniref:Uncharacterized protein n=1 Tax=Colletotrichum scovillei TaxID=1209932 RepID=A0A9P7QXZ5_9PEZI|nr:hypothetical protein JMJ77_0011874 [Colletotrichum scovillei]KAG7046159.1 hypothetical protein JMJ78_0011226 [Colletotrichum scovillei]KAG7063505.1 hypothetical protein JMJ76_0005969 [Colletotrichum scovillei]